MTGRPGRGERVRTEALGRRGVSKLAPRSFGAVVGVLGGGERIVLSYAGREARIVKLEARADEPWGPVAKAARAQRWLLPHFQNPEQRLLTAVRVTDVCWKGRATLIARTRSRDGWLARRAPNAYS